MDILSLAKQTEDFALKHRRYLHQNPELSLQEHNTSQYCQKTLADLGYKIQMIWQTGFIADLNLGFNKTIAFRADMDALPVQEQNNETFISKNKNISHVCGHDAHMAIALGTANIFSKSQKLLKANIRFIFQPSEEVLPGGAIPMIENGALEGVDEIYALHNDPKTQISKIRCLEGAMTANCDIFDITIKGKGGHASTPHNALDPISAAISIISDLNNIIPKNISPFNPAVLGVNYINGGNAENVIPESINFGGIFRSFDEEDRKKIKAQIIQIIENKKNFNYQIEANFTESYPSIVNKKFGQSRVLKAASSFMNEINIIQKGHPETWGEDFAYYLHHVEGAFFILGSGDHAAPPLHSPHYNFNEKALITGIALMAQIGFTF